MKIQAVKGTRDFYPPLMAVHNYIMDGWKKASLRSGFIEYDSPIFEHLRIYQAKSGDEIVEQLFSLTDRGGRDLAIRPEMTPSLARMVNQQINALPRPIKWFSVPRLCRAERPQKGRLREFYQWNIDIIGAEDILADAEIIFCTVDYLRQTGLKPKDIQAKISSRKLLATVLMNLGIEKGDLDSIYPVLDKKARLPQEAFEELLAKNVPSPEARAKIQRLSEAESVEEIGKIVTLDNRTEAALDELKVLFEQIENMGIADYCSFDMSIVRGLAYYTGMVFEVHDVEGDLRAICGGGRYDDLLQDLGGPAVTATGMGMGDCVLEILLRQKGLLDEDIAKNSAGGMDYFIACTDKQFLDKAVETVGKLRLAGRSADFSYKGSNLKKQLKQAAALNVKKCVIIGQEFSDQGKFVVKDMATGTQQLIDNDKLI